VLFILALAFIVLTRFGSGADMVTPGCGIGIDVMPRLLVGTFSAATGALVSGNITSKVCV
jgi:hypothetical protein